MRNKYNHFFILFSLLLFGTVSFGQVNGFNYKSVIYNNGVAIVNQSVTLRFTFYMNAVQQYQETHTTTTSNAGIVIVNMGEGTTVSGSFANINFSEKVSYKVEVNLGSGYADMGTFNFKTVPYALNATTASSLSNPLSINDLKDGKTDNSSLFLGTSSGNLDDGSNYNLGIGQSCLTSNISGFNNVALGTGAMSGNTSGSQNTAVGSNALFMSNGNGNTGVGYGTLNANTNGIYNTGIGYASLLANQAGNNNTALGYYSLKSNLSGNYNTMIGQNSGNANTAGNNNVYIGSNAGANALGSNNVFLGSYAGYNEMGSSKLFISNSSSAYPLIYGDFNSAQLTINGGLSIKDGTQGAGKVYTSNAVGLGSWQSAEKTHTLFLSPINFQPMTDGVAFSRDWAKFYISSNNVSTVLVSLDLPVGANVSSITYYYYDNSTTTDIKFNVYTTTISTGSSGVVNTFVSTGSSTSVREATVTTGFSIVADRVHSITVDANLEAWPGTSALSIRGVKVTYTY